MEAVDEAALPRDTVEAAVDAHVPTKAARPGVRFTSNIVGPIFLIADLLCLAISAPLALAAYDLFLAGDNRR